MAFEGRERADDDRLRANPVFGPGIKARRDAQKYTVAIHVAPRKQICFDFPPAAVDRRVNVREV